MKKRIKGKGLLIRDRGNFPPSARSILQKVGNESITSLKIVRTPLSNTVKDILNVISLGKFQKIYEKYYDKLFHISLLINNKYNLEKNEVI